MRKIARAAAFLLVFLLVYFAVDGVLSTKTEDGIGTLKKYYALPKDTVDVLFVGSSHIGMNLDPSLMMEEYGQAGYALWGGMQPVWNSYYYIKEALKTQTPKVVVAEVFLCGVDAEYVDTAAALKGIQAMKPSLDKFELALCSFPTWQQAVEAMWGMPTYHARYSDLTSADFNLFEAQDVSIQRADHDVSSVTALNMLDYAAISQAHDLAEKQEKYLQKIIDLCKSQDIPIVLLIAPFQATEDEAMRLNRVAEIAAQQDVRVLNYLHHYEDAGISAETDFYDVGHLNVSGITKFTRSLAAYLAENFNLPDRRSDSKHIWSDSNRRAVGQLEADYRLQEVFQGDGANYCIDTGLKILENIYGEWTMLIRLDTNTVMDDGIFLSCFSEVADQGYYGFMLKKTQSDRLCLKLGPNQDRYLPCTDDTMDIAIVKNRTVYTVYVNGKQVLQEDLLCDSYGGTLLLGCQELSPQGERFRFSQTRILNLEHYDSVLDERTIKTWNPEPLPEPEMPLGMLTETPETVYTLPEKFNGAAAPGTYVDTGVRLLESAGTRFTLLASLMPEDTPGDNVFFSCFSEVPGEYRGLLVRQLTEQRLDIIVGNNHGFILPITLGEPINLAIVKDGSVYTAYVNGEKVIDREESRCAAFDGTLLLGAQTDAQGNIFRQSQTRVNSLTVMAGVMSEADILAWPYTEAPDQAPPKPVTSIYTLPHAFAGDGSDNYEDTGVQLFKNPQMNWTLQATVRPRNGGNDGVFFSAFSEDPSAYRGLMLRQDSTDSVTLYMGQLQTCPIAIPEGSDRMSLVVVKQGSHYSVYVNGEKIRELDSPCAAYAGTLLVGCQESVTGEPFRFSTAKVDALEIWDGALPEEEALRLSKPVITHNRFN